MDIFRSPATSNQKDSAWERIQNSLITDRASLSVAGSGDSETEAFTRSEVRARVAGSGDILVRCNPPHRDHSVAGSGKIKFR